MKILALELSTAHGSLAWLNDNVAESGETGQPLQQKRDLVREWPNDRKNSGPFFENLQALTKKLGVPEKIIVGLGPGSYAGVRIAISAAIGLQAASNAHLVGFPSICAMECGEQQYCVIGDARRNLFFFAQIRENELIEGPNLLSETELKEKLDRIERTLSIFASEKLPQFHEAKLCYPSAQILARLAQDEDRQFSLPPLEPIYLREPHITMPKMRHRGIGIPADGDSRAGSPCHNP
jgi:tRNA threonylcarbamoyl adenosine modification protein YeaZ